METLPDGGRQNPDVAPSGNLSGPGGSGRPLTSLSWWRGDRACRPSGPQSGCPGLSMSVGASFRPFSAWMCVAFSTVICLICAAGEKGERKRRRRRRPPLTHQTGQEGRSVGLAGPLLWPLRLFRREEQQKICSGAAALEAAAAGQTASERKASPRPPSLWREWCPYPHLGADLAGRWRV